jgi:hypothetical protein
MHTGLKMGGWDQSSSGGYVVASKVPGVNLFLRTIKVKQSHYRPG